MPESVADGADVLVDNRRDKEAAHHGDRYQGRELCVFADGREIDRFSIWAWHRGSTGLGGSEGARGQDEQGWGGELHYCRSFG